MTETRTWDALNQIIDTEIADGLSPVTWTYSHDPNGCLTAKTDGTDTYTYLWDAGNRLVGVELNSTPIVSYEYNSASRLIKRVEGGTTTLFTRDGWDLVKEVKSGTVNETTNYLVPFGEVLAFERGGDWFYLHGDGLSSTQLVTDENGDQVGRFIYSAWGEELYASESVPGILENRFVGGLGCRRDADTGLIYMRHRWYDSTCQRFISRDPIGLAGGINLYSYPERPTDTTDSFGLKPCNCCPPNPTPMHHDWVNSVHWNNDPGDAPLRVAERKLQPKSEEIVDQIEIPDPPFRPKHGNYGPQPLDPVHGDRTFEVENRRLIYKSIMQARKRSPGRSLSNQEWFNAQIVGPWNYESSLGRAFHMTNYGATAAALGWTEEEIFRYGFWSQSDKAFVRKGIEFEQGCPR